ncbi:chloride channel protein 2-like isoform X2 [Bolinopsis microptera]|uniref:chloride channel protein 2-like isoform X2 n=1 Tax=Bolinopsis microptera TaxID=2820187 RepID=UPI003079DD6D
MFIQSLIRSNSGDSEAEDREELLDKQDREDYNVMPHFKNRTDDQEEILVMEDGAPPRLNRQHSDGFQHHQHSQLRARLDIQDDLEECDLIEGGNSCSRSCYSCWKYYVLDTFGDDWLFCLLLGISMALISFAMDFCILKLQETHVFFYNDLTTNPILRFLLWTVYPLLCIIFSVSVVQVISLNAVGSGIPEMKTILRGIVIHNYLTWQTLISKVIGLCFSMGSGLPIGKEGPFVHIACIMSNLLGQNVKGFKRIFSNETRNVEMLAAACAVGVSCTFAAPIGGVLFSIEVTSTYFAVRNYWRGFFTAVCGSFVFRMMDVWISNEATITTLYPTNFSGDFPFDPLELVAFSLMGLLAGLGGATFVYMHRKIVFLIRNHGHKIFLHKNKFVYPCIVTLVVMIISFPDWLGQFMGGKLTQKDSLEHMFSDQSWSITTDEDIKAVWADPNIFVSLLFFIVFQFVMTAFCVSLPVPAGVFFPIFVLGAAYGRLCGEAMTAWFPEGIHEGQNNFFIQPGGYAVVGAAAFSGAVTHTISTSVIVFELTGQISHIIPVMIAVLIANAAAQWLQPSIYDSIIQIKKLPYLPEISSKHTHLYNKYVKDIMRRDIIFCSYESTCRQIQQMLQTTDYRSFPIVDNVESMTFLGSIRRVFLERALERALQYNQLQSPSVSYGDLKDLEKYGDRPVVDNKAAIFGSITRHSANSKASAVPVTSTLLGVPDGVTTQDYTTWYESQLDKRMDFSKCPMDGAPFQLVDTTSIYKAHTLFGLLSLSHAYITEVGQLVGVMTLNEIQDYLEGRIQIDDNRDPRAGQRPSGGASGTIQSTFELDPMHIIHK